MGDQTLSERRQHQRHPLATSLQFLHGPTRKDCQARSVDVSAGGMMMFVPPNVPVRVGQFLRLSVGSVNRPEFAGLSEQPVDATVVRVDRGQLVPGGQIGIGVRFHSPAS